MAGYRTGAWIETGKAVSYIESPTDACGVVWKVWVVDCIGRVVKRAVRKRYKVVWIGKVIDCAGGWYRMVWAKA